MFYSRATGQLLFSSNQPPQLQSYVVGGGAQPLQVPLRNLFYHTEVSQKWIGASSSTKNILMSLMKRNLALKVIEKMMINPLI